MLSKVFTGVAVATTVVSAAETQKSAISKVVELLKKMQEQIAEDKATDKATHDEFACWCMENKQKTEFNIEDENKKIEDNTSRAAEQAALSARLKTEIVQLESEIKSDREQLNKARQERLKDQKVNTKEINEKTQYISQLNGALTVLKKHNSLTQKEFNQVSSLLQASGFQGALNQRPDDKDTVSAFIQGGFAKFSNGNNYDTSSGEIFGVIGAMHDEFKADLAKAEEDESEAAANFSDLRTNLQANIDLNSKTSTKKQKEKGHADLAHEDAKRKLQKAKNTLADLLEFQAKMKVDCKENGEEYRARSESQAAELVAINDTIGILMEDAARDVAGRAVPAFVQISSSNLRSRAAKVLKKAAVKAQGPELAMLATSVQLDSFSVVVKAIDGFLATLKQKKEDEKVEKDTCIKEIQDSDITLAENEFTLKGYVADKAATEAAIDQNVKETKSNREKNNQNDIDMATATQLRREENAEYQQSWNDQAATQVVLKKAIARMNQYYEDAPAAPKGFLQKEGTFAPVGLGSKKGGYEKNEQGSGVVSMLIEVARDSQRVQAEAVKTEQEAQSAYEAFVGDYNKASANFAAELRALQKEATNLDKQLNQDISNIEAATDTRDSEQATLSALHGKCDWWVKNFEVRQSGYDDEMQALGEAKNILKGAGSS